MISSLDAPHHVAASSSVSTCFLPHVVVPRRPMTHKELIMALGGPRAVADRMPEYVRLRTVRRWRDRDRIPWAYREFVRQMVIRENRKRRAKDEPEISLPAGFINPLVMEG